MTKFTERWFDVGGRQVASLRSLLAELFELRNTAKLTGGITREMIAQGVLKKDDLLDFAHEYVMNDENWSVQPNQNSARIAQIRTNIEQIVALRRNTT